ncbi:hypothetical protein HYC85_007560 [Camellia sinensis]|uniref:Major facilitator superfamily (MFS) profile domain-containing protein n=1 Tax=Camellia sinensis TaxID=4442 RepID=A0A7J7HRP9_CAMSI|nr:hypothetical protein HYC85_007560 [Camellia sinensis]
MCRSWGDERSRTVHQEGPEDLGRPAGNPDGHLPPRFRHRRPNLRLVGAPVHHRPRLRDLLRGSHPHGLRHQLRLPHGRPVGRRHWRWPCPHDRPRLHRRGLPRRLSWLPRILLGYVSNYAFSKLPLHLGWRFMLGVGAIPSVFLALGVLAMPESPRWLVLQGRLGDAKRVLDKTSDSKEEAQLRLADIKEAVGIPEECNDDVVQVSKRSHGEDVWKELFLHPTPTVKHILLAVVGIHFFQQTSGIDAVVLYSPKIFEKAGITNENFKLLATVAVGFVKTLFILVATFLLDRIGRRPLLLNSVAGMVVSLATLGMSLTIIDHSDKKLIWAVALAITSVLAYVATFSIGMGPITWVYSSEIFPLRLRAQGICVGVAVNRVMSGTLSMTFLSLYKAITIGGAFFLFMGVAMVGWVFFYTLLPETQGKTLEEMQVLFGTFFRWRSTMRELEKNNNGVNGTGDGNDNKGISNGQIQMGTTKG